MVTVQTQELSGSALDYVVALIEHKRAKYNYGDVCFDPKTKRVYQTEGLRQVGVNYNPSKDGKAAFDIIHREQIWLTGPYRDRKDWKANSGLVASEDFSGSTQLGADPLIAAMRCYVWVNYGDIVEVPPELL